MISASASLFGEWSANIVSFEPLPSDPIVRNALVESDLAGGEAWPGATLPDIGQLTAQASRIAGDVGDITARIGQAFDSTALKDLQQSVKDLAEISRRMVKFADAQTSRIDRVSSNVATTSDAFAGVARTFQQAVARLDTATADGQLEDILANGQASSADLRQAAADMRSVMAAARANEASLVRVMQQADSLMTRIQQGNGTLGHPGDRLDALPRGHGDRGPVPRAADRHPGAAPQVSEDLGVLDEQAEGRSGGERGRDRVPAGARGAAAVSADQGLLRQLGLSQGTSRERRVAGRGRDPGDRGRDRAEPPGPAGADPGHRLALPLPRPPHPQVLPLLPVREPGGRALSPGGRGHHRLPVADAGRGARRRSATTTPAACSSAPGRWSAPWSRSAREGRCGGTD